MTWHSRLVAYEPGTGTRIGYLPDALSYEASLPRNDAGALRLTYSRKAVGGSVFERPLRDGLDVALEVNWLGGVDDWVEPAGGRFVWADVQDDAADETDTVSLVLPSYGWLLGKIGINALELLETSGPDAGRRLFVPGRAGLLRTLLDEWASRHPGALLRLAWNFSATHDSTGAVWARTLDAIPYDAHTPLSTVLASLASMDGGLCDWETVGRTLNLYNPDSRVADLSATVRLELRRDVSDAPSQETIADSAGWIMVRGEGNVVGVYADAGVPDQIAAWETTLQASGASTEADALAAAAGDIEWRARDRGQYTRQLLLTDRARWLPLRDYLPGDVVSAWARTDRRAMRVQQITLSRDGQGQHSGSVVLNDRLVPDSLRQARALKALSQNAAITGPGTVIPATDTRQPAAPDAPTLSDQRILDAVGVWRSRIGASWLAVTQATNGTALVPVRYELWGQPMTGGTGLWRRLTTAADGALSAAWEPFDTGTTWRFAVKAVGPNGKASELGAYTQWTFGPDTTAPNKPAAPTVTAYLGAIVIAWGGKDTGGADQPGDFARCEVHVSTTSGFAPIAATLQGEVRPGSTLTLAGLAYGVVHYVRLVAVDFSGNRSVASDQVAVTPRRAVTDDMAQSAIDAIRDYTVDEVRTGLGGRTTMSESTPPTPYAGATGDKWERYVSGALVAAWQWTGSTWVPLSIDPTYIPQIDIGAGTFGSLSGSRLEVGSVAAESLLLSDFTNHVENSGFETGDFTGWTVTNPWYNTSDAPRSGLRNAGANAVASTTHTLISNVAVSVAPGDTWVATAWIRTHLGTSPGAAVSLGIIRDDGTTSTMSIPIAAGTWTRYIFTYTIPAGVKTIRARVAMAGGSAPSGFIRVDDVSLRRANAGELLVDGSVTSNKMSAEEVYAIRNYAGPLTGNHTRMAPDGFSAWAPNPDAGDAIQPFARFGDGLSFGFDQTKPKLRLTAEGQGSFTEVASDALMVGGQTLDQILAPLPRGVVARTAGIANATGITTTKTPLTELRAVLQPGRSYWIGANVLPLQTSAADTVAEMAIHIAYDGTAVTTASPARIFRTTLDTAGVYLHQPPLTYELDTSGWSTAREVRLLLSAVRHSGTGTLAVWGSDLSLQIEDKGASVPSATTGIRYVSEWVASAGWQHSYVNPTVSSLNVLSACEASTLTDWSQAVFAANAVAGETSRTVAAAMSGATLLKAEAFVSLTEAIQQSIADPEKTYPYSPQLRIHPTANTSSNPTLPGSYSTSPPFSPPQGRWIDITALWTTAHRGIYVSLPPVAAGRAAHATGVTPRLRLTYFR